MEYLSLLIQFILGFKHLLTIFLLILSIYGLVKGILKKKKKPKIIFSVIIVYCVVVLFIGAYNAYLRPNIVKSDVNPQDVEFMVQKLLDKTYKPEDFFANYQDPDLPFEKYDSSTGKSGMTEDGHFENSFRKRVKELKLLSSHSYIFSATVYPSKEKAKENYQEFKEQELYYYNDAYYSAYNHKYDILQNSTIISREDYEITIFPTTLTSRFVSDLHNGEYDSEWDSIIGYYGETVFGLQGFSETGKSNFPELIEKQELFDPEFKGLKRAKLVKE